METRLLDLNAYGVEEMSVAEMQKVDGGWWKFVLGAIVGGLIYDAAKWLVNSKDQAARAVCLYVIKTWPD